MDQEDDITEMQCKNEKRRREERLVRDSSLRGGVRKDWSEPVR